MQLAHVERPFTKGAALSREAACKRLTRAQKLALIACAATTNSLHAPDDDPKPKLEPSRDARPVAAAAATPSCLTAAAGSDMTGSAPAPTNFAEINKQILQPSCVFSVCHDADGRAHVEHAQPRRRLDGRGQGRLRGARRSAGGEREGERGRALARQAVRRDQQLLDHQVHAAGRARFPDADYGARMPSGSAALPADQVQAIEDWINRGALFDEPATVSGSTCTVPADGGI